MAEINPQEQLDLSATLTHNPRVDAAQAAEMLEYVAKLQAEGINLKPRYSISRPFSTRPIEQLPESISSRNIPN